MKTLLKCSLMVSALVLSGSALTEDGFEQTPMAQFLTPNESAEGSNERFAEMLEREPTAAGEEQQADESEPENYRSPERPDPQDSYQQ
jgi:hypothetical protein